MKITIKQLKMGIVFFIIALAAAALQFYSFQGTGGLSKILYSLNMSMDDRVYQKEQPIDGTIKIVGIDAGSLEQLGPFTEWTRADMAQVIEILNSDPENKPAVIGVDIMYFGETDPDEDQYLADVCREGGNVVMVSSANFADTLVIKDDGTQYMDDYGIESYEEPYDSLKESSYQGFANTMMDKDGIIRTAIYQLALPDGRVVNSFSNEIYQRYAKTAGLPKEVKPRMNSRYQWYIPYSSGSGGYYEDIGVADILNGEISPEELAGCIVLIGPYAAGLMDDYYTAIDHTVKMNGVEIHANILDALIHQNFKMYVPDIWQCVLLFLVVLIGLILFNKLKMFHAVFLYIGLTAIYLMIAAAGYKRGYILHILWIPLFIFLVFVSAIALNYLRASAEKRKVVDTFKHYVAPQIVDEIFKDGIEKLELGGKMTDIACLFVDIRGFTAMSEVLEPTEVVEILNTYLNLTSSCILKHNGTLDKFVGDATMALFNAPLPQEDYIYQAVLTAWDMIQGSEAVSKELMERFGRTVSFGVGVHCGKAVVGNIGAQIRMDYTAIGDTVNTAARLEANAKGGTILISRSVYDALEGRIKATSLGTSIKLKGKSDEFEIFTVDGIVSDE